MIYRHQMNASAIVYDVLCNLLSEFAEIVNANSCRIVQ